MVGIFLVGKTNAQSIISGILIDGDTKEPLIGGHVELNFTSDSLIYNGVSDFNGVFSIQLQESGQCDVKVSYIGYKTVNQRFIIEDETLDIGTIEMTVASDLLDEVRVVARQQRTIQKGDTTQYNASAYGANPDAAAIDLIQKMPGFILDDNGKMQVQGEQVARILVNGKPFFSDDPNMALTNLPAEAIDNIQVYERQDEEEEASGFSNGNTAKTINIILRPEFNNGTFGKSYAGYGSDNKYKLGGNLNMVNDQRRINVLGQFNNINQQNFSSADLLGVTQAIKQGGNNKFRSGSSKDFLVPRKGGINETNAIGINYQENWNAKTEVSASYFFNKSANQSESRLDREYFNRSSPFSFEESSISNGDNSNHRFNARIRYKINAKNSIFIQPVLTVQQNQGKSEGNSSTISNGDLSNSLTDIFRSDLSAVKLTNRIVYKHQFNKKSRVLTVTVRNTYDTSTGDRISIAENTNFNNAETSLLDQNSVLDNTLRSYSASIRYTEPLRNRSSLLLGYTIGQEDYQSEIITSDYNDTEEVYDLLNSGLSTEFSRKYFRQKGEIGFGKKSKKLKLEIRGGYQIADFANEQVFPESQSIDKIFRNFLPSASLTYRINKHNNFQFRYWASTRLPKIQDLQSIVNNQNPLRLRIGNPELDQQVNQIFRLKYNSNNPIKSTTFFAMLQGNFAQDYISNNLIIATVQDTIEGVILPRGGQLRTPVNLADYGNARLFMSYGLPVPKLKSNFNINFTYNYRHTPAQIDNISFITQTQNISTGIVWGSNISPSIDFTVKTNVSLILSQNDFIDQNKVVSQRSTASLNYIVANKWRINTNITHRVYKTFRANSNDSFLLWNASLGYKFLKENRGELSLSLFDILNTNTNIAQYFNENSFTQRESLTLRRFAMLSFHYNIRAFSK